MIRVRFMVLAALAVYPAHALYAQAAPTHNLDPRVQLIKDELADPLVIRAITAPIRSVELAADLAATIESIPISEGDFVLRHTTLVQFRADLQKIATEIAQARAESTIEIETAKAKLGQAQSEYDRFSRLNRSDSASDKEANDALHLVTLRTLDLKLAEFEAEQARRAFLQAQSRLDMHTVRAPFDGFVTELHHHEGESVEEQQPVLTLVQIDPLEVIVDCPIEHVSKIKKGQRYIVQPTDDHESPRVGNVSFVGKVADPASQTVRIKLSVGNDDAVWLAGLKVVVDFRSEFTGQESSVAEADQHVR